MSSLGETKNTVDTLKSYESIAALRNKPMPCMYYENSKEVRRSVVDEKIMTSIILLAAFFSGENAELDSEDLKNFLNYSNVVVGGLPSRLVSLEFVNGKIKPVKGTSVPAAVTLADENSDTDPGVLLKYRTAGFISDAARKALPDLSLLPIHMVLVTGHFQDIISRMDNTINNIETTFGTIVDKPIVTGDSAVSGNGLVF